MTKPKLANHYWILVDERGHVDSFTTFVDSPVLYPTAEDAGINATENERSVKVRIVVDEVEEERSQNANT
ncbi:MAG: hypothetical protein WC485_00295 [Opitutaceae bacterium]